MEYKGVLDDKTIREAIDLWFRSYEDRNQCWLKYLFLLIVFVSSNLYTSA
jgi:hypothetical protein